MRQAVEEIHSLFGEVRKTLEQFPSEKNAPPVRHVTSTCIQSRTRSTLPSMARLACSYSHVVWAGCLAIGVLSCVKNKVRWVGLGLAQWRVLTPVHLAVGRGFHDDPVRGDPPQQTVRVGIPDGAGEEVTAATMGRRRSAATRTEGKPFPSRGALPFRVGTHDRGHTLTIANVTPFAPSISYAEHEMHTSDLRPPPLTSWACRRHSWPCTICESNDIASSHSLSPPRITQTEFFVQYNRSLNTYTRNVGIDLTTDLLPPKELFIEVRCLEDIGEIATEDGTVQLEEGSQHFLRRSDVEPLIRAGKLEHLV